MNMNYCYTYNWWIIYNSQDPGSGLVWLKQILENAERNGEKVQMNLTVIRINNKIF